MKKNQTLKIAFCLIIIAACVIFSVYTIAKSKKGNNVELTENEVLKDATVGDLTFTKGEIYTSDGTSNFRVIVTNKGDKEFHINKLFVSFTVDGSTQKIQSLSDTTLKANESKVIKIVLDSDVSEATKIEYIVE